MSDDRPEKVIPDRKFFQSEHEPSATGTAYLPNGKAYTPHNYLFNEKFNNNYTAQEDVLEWKPDAPNAGQKKKWPIENDTKSKMTK